MIDFHSHILPGIDDGARDPETSRLLLEASMEQGITEVVLTPHFYADEDSIDAFLENRESAFDKIKDISGLKLYQAAEVAFFPGMSMSSGLDKLVLRGSAGDDRILMIEMPYREWRSTYIDEIKSLIYDRDYTVVLAHLERFMTRPNAEYIRILEELPLVIQINCESLLDRHFRETTMFKTGCEYVLGSDCHSLHRRPQNMAEGRSRLSPGLLERIDTTGAELLGL